MSKLATIREALEINPEVTIVSAEEISYLPGRRMFFSYTADYYVAPKGGLYTVPELQGFMMGLIPGLVSTLKDDFMQFEDGNLRFGKLYFDEKIGEEKIVTRTIMTLTDEELLNMDGFIDGKQTIDESVTRDYMRRTWVRLFPDERVAKDMIGGRLGYSKENISSSDLKRYKPGLIRRLIGSK